MDGDSIRPIEVSVSGIFNRYYYDKPAPPSSTAFATEFQTEVSPYSGWMHSSPSTGNHSALASLSQNGDPTTELHPLFDPSLGFIFNDAFVV